MSRKMAVYEPFLKPEHREKMRAAAEKNGFEVRLVDSPEQDRDYLMECEVIFGQLPEIARASSELKWICTPFAGVDQFLKPDSFANPEAMLSNSSGAYGVTISEHSIMMLLDILRRQPEYRRIVEAREWKRDLKIRSIRDSQVTLLGTGDIGQETARRLKAFAPKSITGVNRSGKTPGECFDRILTGQEWETVLPETDVLVISLPGTVEAFRMVGKKQLALLPDGRLLVSCRPGFYGPRWINTAVKGEDGVWHWEGTRTSEGLEANNCNGDLLPWGKGLILHSYIKEKETRKGLTLAVSADGGDSWKDILTLQPGSAAYSTMVAFKNGDVGILYEDGTNSLDGGYDIVFARIPRRLLKASLPR